MPENENQGNTATATMEAPMPHEEQAENRPPLQGQGSHNAQNQGSLNQSTSVGQTPGHAATQGQSQSQAQSPSYSSSPQSSSSTPSTAGGASGTSGMSGYEGRRSSGLSRRDPFSALGFGNPFAMMRQLADEMDRVFDNLGFGSPSARLSSESRSLDRPTMGMGGGSAFWSPQIDVSRRGNELVVCADLPGMKKEDIRVEIREDHLILEGERRQEQEEDREGYFRSERSWGRFYRAIPLPDGVNPEQAQARFNDGVLEIKMPLPQQQERSRRIEIR